MNIYLIILLISAGAVAGLAGLWWIYKKKQRRAANESLIQEMDLSRDEDVSLEKQIKRDLSQSATEIFQTFKAYIDDKEIPFRRIENGPAYVTREEEPRMLNRQERRRIKRHYKKFLYAWPDIPAKKQNVHLIVQYLSITHRNHNVVQDYLEYAPNKYV